MKSEHTNNLFQDYWYSSMNLCDSKFQIRMYCYSNFGTNIQLYINQCSIKKVTFLNNSPWISIQCKNRRKFTLKVNEIHANKQAEKLKSREMKEGWMKNYEWWWRMNEEWWRMNDEEWMMKVDDFKLLRDFDNWQTDEQTNRHLWM